MKRCRSLCSSRSTSSGLAPSYSVSWPWKWIWSHCRRRTDPSSKFIMVTMRFPRFCMTTLCASSCLVPLKKVTSVEETLCRLVRSARFLSSFEGLSPVVACLAFRYYRMNESMHCSRFWKDVGAMALTALVFSSEKTWFNYREFHLENYLAGVPPTWCLLVNSIITLLKFVWR